MAIIIRSGLRVVAALAVAMAGPAAAVDAIGVLLLVLEGSEAFPLVGVIVGTCTVAIGVLPVAETCAINIDDNDNGNCNGDGDGDDVTSGE
jgi:hypothetical protein